MVTLYSLKKTQPLSMQIIKSSGSWVFLFVAFFFKIGSLTFTNKSTIISVILPFWRRHRVKRRGCKNNNQCFWPSNLIECSRMWMMLKGTCKTVILFCFSDSQRIGGGSGYWAIVVLFVICLVAVGAFILYKFKRQVNLHQYFIIRF